MIVFLNGEFVPEEAAVVSIFDRSFLYGDGLFETLRALNGRPFRWDAHLERLQRGADFLKIKLPYSADVLRQFADELIRRNQMPDALLRITVSRGIGLRGYSPKSANRPTLVMSVHAGPHPQPLSHPMGEGGRRTGEGIRPKWKLITASPRLPNGDALAQFKTCNKLPQVIARMEADAAGADEALLLNTGGHVVEGASSNLFWTESDAVCTPPLTDGILPGVTRAVILEICRRIGLTVREQNIFPEDLRRRSGVFVSLSSWGIVEAQSLDGIALEPAAVASRIRDEYFAMLTAETADGESINL